MILKETIEFIAAIMTIIVSSIAIGGALVAHEKGFFTSLHAIVKHNHELIKKNHANETSEYKTIDETGEK